MHVYTHFHTSSYVDSYMHMEHMCIQCTSWHRKYTSTHDMYDFLTGNKNTFPMHMNTHDYRSYGIDTLSGLKIFA